jgi:hypothetical protein
MSAFLGSSIPGFGKRCQDNQANARTIRLQHRCENPPSKCSISYPVKIVTARDAFRSKRGLLFQKCAVLITV